MRVRSNDGAEINGHLAPTFRHTQIDDECTLSLEGEMNISQDKTGMRVEVEQMCHPRHLKNKFVCLL